MEQPRQLRRALGRWDLTAIGVNQVIGGAIFLMPSQVAAQVGAWGPLAFLAIGFASLLVALCFAEVGSRFEGTGGPFFCLGCYKAHIMDPPWRDEPFI